MRSYSLLAPAKINLYLGIVGDRPDGFHELVMVLQSIGLADRVTITETTQPGIHLTCSDSEVPQDDTNLAYKAADLIYQRFPEVAKRQSGVSIAIDKQIPMGAGLAGGSADCAAVLVGMDLLWDLGLTQSELQTLAAELGSDIPFCVGGGTALATGRGELLDPLPDLDNLHLVLAKYRDLPVSTPWAYQTFRRTFGTEYPTTPDAFIAKQQALRSSQMLRAIADRNPDAIAQHLYNDLERVVLPEYPQVQALRDRFEAFGAMGTMMSGSGSTVFALCKTASQAEGLKIQMESAFNDPDLELWVTQFRSTGIQIL
ncbi:MAG: 4-(cytidine 5'-diphospho)-2-C-methyl-D-erythritol kinase [Alkalinema sp. RU_4_3]|nr:4-(cytidine 5'-diphospho)-2-C-methyl-D-erythritol kinase [Alkalinema sp. RU_4_3]